MKFKELLGVANSGYSKENGDIDLTKINPKGGGRFHGDSLADFVVRELHDTFDQRADDGEQLGEAIRVMRMARRDIENTIAALEDAAERMPA